MKRHREKNFSNNEVALLLEGMKLQINVIENKKKQIRDQMYVKKLHGKKLLKCLKWQQTAQAKHPIN